MTQPSFQKVIYTGDLAPLVGNGAIYQAILSPPVINNRGELVFVGALGHGIGGVTSTNEYVLWHVGQNQQWTKIAQKGDPAHHDSSGLYMTPFYSPISMIRVTYPFQAIVKRELAIPPWSLEPMTLVGG